MTVPTDEGPTPSPSRPPERGARLPEAVEASSALDRAMVLAEVMDYVVQASKPTPLVLPRPRVWIPLMTLFFCCFALYSYSARPEWIWGLQQDPNAVLASHDADMRLAIYGAAQQISAYEIEWGRLPTSLAQAGVRLDTVSYVVLSDTSFSLRYEAEHPIIYYSTESPADFLGNSLSVVGSTGCAKCAAQR